MQEIYFDNAATTKPDSIVIERITDILKNNYGNPSSLYSKGIDAQMLVENARKSIADMLACREDEIYFTAGGTEADNIALLGTAEAHKRRGGRIIVSALEHDAVYRPAKNLSEESFEVVPVKGGNIEDAIIEAVDENTILVSCMYVNNETGQVFDIKRLVREVKRKNLQTLIHTDAVQAFGKTPVNVRDLGVDMLTLSGHKIYAPKGIGALYIKKGTRIKPLFYGGGQEKGLRPGTENTAYISALGLASENAHRDMAKNFEHVKMLKDYFVKKAENFDGLCINSPENGTPYIVNISLPGYKSEVLLHSLESYGIYVSSGSACSKGAKSRVLENLNLAPKLLDSALRISFGKYNNTQEIDSFFKALKEIKEKLVRKN